MKCLIAMFQLFLVFSCKSEDDNGFSCIRFDENAGHLELYCANFTGAMPRTCSKVYLREVSDIFSSDAQEIKQLTYNGCYENSIPHLKNLLSLDISQSKYTNLSLIRLNHRYLENFNASHNDIESVSFDYFKLAPNLNEIDLSYNRIARIDKRTFENLEHLEYINLSNNMIEFNDGLFLSAINLKTIYMEHNPLVELKCGLFALAKMGVLIRISWKNIKKIDKECLKEADIVLSENESIVPVAAASPHGKLTLQCNEMSFGMIWGPFHLDFVQCFSSNITHLELYGNLHGKLNHDIFKRFTQLNELDLSHTRLKEFDLIWLKSNEKLKTLRLSNNHLKSLENAWVLQTFENLMELDLTGNQIENALEVIKYLSSTVRLLNLRGNRIGTLNATALAHLERLEELDIRNTDLSFEDQSPFEQLQSLETLMISDNNLEHIDFPMPTMILKKLLYFYASNCKMANATKLIKFLPPTLLRLDLSGNLLGTIDGTTFESIPHLLQLYLENSNLKMTEWNAFNHLNELSVLDISDNNFENVHISSSSSQPLNRMVRFYARNCSITNVSDYLNIFPSLMHLDLSDNTLNDVTADTFTNAKNLKYLRLRNTNLSTFDFNTIDKRIWYLDLDLSYNRLKRVDLSPLEHVEDLNLEGNDLIELDTLREPQTVDMHLMISNNQLSCEYLMTFIARVKHFRRLHIIGDPWKQKHRENCQQQTNADSIIIEASDIVGLK